MHELLARSEPEDTIATPQAPQKKERKESMSKKVHIEEPEFVVEEAPKKKRQVKKVA